MIDPGYEPCIFDEWNAKRLWGGAVKMVRLGWRYLRIGKYSTKGVCELVVILVQNSNNT